MSDELIRVLEVFGDISYDNLFITRIICRLEDDRYFILERVPFDIVLALKRINGEEIDDDRERLVDILLSMPQVRELLGKSLKRVIIDSIDYRTGVYRAIAEFSDGELVIKRKMVPSHAIFLAVLTGRPIYVRKELVDEQEDILNATNIGFSEGDIEEYEDYEEYDDTDQ